MFTTLIVLGATVTLIPGLNVWGFLVAVQVVNGVVLPILLVFITLLAGRRDLMGDHATGPIYRAFAWLTTLVIGGLAVLLVIATLALPIFGVERGS